MFSWFSEQQRSSIPSERTNPLIDNKADRELRADYRTLYNAVCTPFSYPAAFMWVRSTTRADSDVTHIPTWGRKVVQLHKQNRLS
jgi:hypothetical protein